MPYLQTDHMVQINQSNFFYFTAYIILVSIITENTVGYLDSKIYM